MPQITKTVDKTNVQGSETFIYTFNVSFSDLAQANAHGTLVDFFPSKIKFNLPKIQGQIVNITSSPVEGGTKVVFDFGQVNAGTSINFQVSCSFGPGRSQNDSFTNTARLYAGEVEVGSSTASPVNLTLIGTFSLAQSVGGGKLTVQPGQKVSLSLTIRNNGDAGIAINNIELSDILPAKLSPDTSTAPVGNDSSREFKDTTYNGLKGRWDDKTLSFSLPSYKGSEYTINFVAIVSTDVKPGESIPNVGTWTIDGVRQKDAALALTVYQPQYGLGVRKGASKFANIGEIIQYSINMVNNGDQKLYNLVFTDTMPLEVDVTAVSLRMGTDVTKEYSISVLTSDNPTVYKDVAIKVTTNFVSYDLTPFIPTGERITSIQITSPTLLPGSSSTSVVIQGIVNTKAVVDSVITNTANLEAVSDNGEKYTSQASIGTIINGKSHLSLAKAMSPLKAVYYPLDQINVKLTFNGKVNNPVLGDLLPLGLDYSPGNDFFTYTDGLTSKKYDSRLGSLPIDLPIREVIKNYQGTGRTLVRYKFINCIIPVLNAVEVNFTAIILLTSPSSFINKAFIGNPGKDAEVRLYPTTDTMDFDGDGFTDEKIAESLTTKGTVLTSSEFSLEKSVKGSRNLFFSQIGNVISGGDIVYKLNVTNNQQSILKDIVIVDILPYVGDTGVILNTTPRGSEFNVSATTAITAEIINLLGDPVENPNPTINIQYSTSKDPIRFNATGTETIGTGTWSSVPPADITTLAAIQVTTGSEVTLNSYERLVVTINAKAPVGLKASAKAYNSYAVKANKVVSGVTTPMTPAEPNKVQVIVLDSNLGAIGGFVWVDTNGSGIFDAGEEGANNVTVELYDKDMKLLKSTITSNNSAGEPGYYAFNDLVEENYFVKFIPFEPYTLTVQKEGTLNGSQPNQSTGLTSLISLPENTKNTTIHAGFVAGKPTINASNQCLSVGDSFNPLNGVTATDSNGEDLTSSIKVESNDVDTTKAGTYSVTYSVTNSSGGTASATISVKICEQCPYYEAIGNLEKSVALQKIALDNILKAEASKVEKALTLNPSASEMTAINDSIEETKEAILLLSAILDKKLNTAKCDSCCKDF